jgi:DNA-binding GntR family transcriptional regulator
MEREFKLVIDQPVSIREQVLKGIGQMILSGQIGPLERIFEGKLAKQLGVSRTPVREALHILEMQGFLEALPRIGYQVKETCWDELTQICEIRTITETLVVRWAIEKITPEELSALEANVNEAETELENGITERFVSLDAGFHDILFRASGSRMLEEICRLLRRHMYLYRMRALHEPDSAKNTLKGHRAILERIRERDVLGAEMAVRDHLEFVKRDICQNVFEGQPSS